MNSFDYKSDSHKVLALGDTYHNTHCAIYDGAIHVRQGRHVIIVWDIAKDTVRVNRLYSATDRKRVNDVLEILGTTAQVVELRYNHPEIHKHPAQFTTGPIYAWAHHPSDSECRVQRFIPRETVTLTALGGTS